jgi:hypothetical protein
VLGQAEAIGPEGVRLDDLGAGLEVGAVHVDDPLGLQQAQLVERPLEAARALVQHRAHRAVAQDRPARQALEKRMCRHGTHS